MPADTPEYTIDMTRPLLTPSFMQADTALPRHVPFWPEHRLSWYQAFATWMANLYALPHIDLEITLHFRLLDYCQQVFPCHWACDSAEQDLLQYPAIDFHSTAWIQYFQFQQLLYELEHVLAQDWLLRCLALDLIDGTYERRRSIFCRIDGSLWQSLCKEAQNRGGGTAIRPTAYTQGAAEALALIGFGLGRRWKLDFHDRQIDPSTGGSIQPASPRQELHLLRTGRKRQYSAVDAEVVQGLAWAEGIRSSHDILEATHIQSSVRGIGLSSFETTLRIKRSRIDSSPSEQADIDNNQLLELPSLGTQGENSEACSPRSPSIRGSRSFDPEDSYPDGSGRLDPQGLGTETHASGLDSHGLSGGAMAPGHLTEGPSSSGPVRVPTEIDRQRAYAADLRSNPTVDTAKVTIGSGHCSSLDEMRQAILTLSLGNVSNACYMNSALLAELWACCMDDTFVWHEVGHWKDPLIRLLANSNTHQMLQDEHCLGQLLQSWHTSHEMGKQQDSAEFVGWLRYAMHGASTDSGKTVSKWEARLEATTEDSGSLFAPVLLQQTKDGDCTLQDLVNLWHEQVPFHCGCSDSTTTVCLQVSRFPTLGVKTAQPFRWNRISVHLPCFIQEHNRTVRWKYFEIVSVVVHRGSESHSGHYQACLRTGGSRFLTDDWSRALPCAYTPDLEQDLYLLWLVDSGHLTSAWKSLIHCNPFVPFPTSQEPSFRCRPGAMDVQDAADLRIDAQHGQSYPTGNE